MKRNDLALKTLYLSRMLLQKYGNGRPYHCQFQVTRRCNFRCAYCRVWAEEQDPAGELDGDGIAVLSRNLRSIGVRSVALTGGEPLLREDLLGIIGTFRRDRLLVRLQTNGSLPDDRFLEAAFSRGLNDIFLSLDTLEDGLFSRLSGTGESALPGRVRENIAVAARIAGRQRAGAFLLTVLQPENSGEVDELVAFAREHRCLIGFYGREEGPRGEGNDIRAEERRPALTEEGRTKLLQAFTRLRSLKLRSGSPVFNSLRHIEDYLRFYGTGGRDMRWNCSAGDSYLAVLPDGRGCICNATPPVPGLDHRSMPAFYARPGRTELFQRRRAACAGCLCTRQLEHLVHDWADIGRKTLQYARMTLLRP